MASRPDTPRNRGDHDAPLGLMGRLALGDTAAALNELVADLRETAAELGGDDGRRTGAKEGPALARPAQAGKLSRQADEKAKAHADALGASTFGSTLRPGDLPPDAARPVDHPLDQPTLVTRRVPDGVSCAVR
jgi:hypothetical protein